MDMSQEHESQKTTCKKTSSQENRYQVPLAETVVLPEKSNKSTPEQQYENTAPEGTFPISIISCVVIPHLESLHQVPEQRREVQSVSLPQLCLDEVGRIADVFLPTRLDAAQVTRFLVGGHVDSKPQAQESVAAMEGTLQLYQHSKHYRE